MILNEESQKAIESKNEEALIEALSKDYTPSAARYLAGKLLGTITDSNQIQ